MIQKIVNRYRYIIIFVIIAVVFITTFKFDGNKNIRQDKHYSFDSALLFLKLGVGEYEIPVGDE